MGSALRRYKNAKAALYKCQEREDRVKELPGRGGEIRVSNSREREDRRAGEGRKIAYPYDAKLRRIDQLNKN